MIQHDYVVPVKKSWDPNAVTCIRCRSPCAVLMGFLRPSLGLRLGGLEFFAACWTPFLEDHTSCYQSISSELQFSEVVQADAVVAVLTSVASAHCSTGHLQQ